MFYFSTNDDKKRTHFQKFFSKIELDELYKLWLLIIMEEFLFNGKNFVM